MRGVVIYFLVLVKMNLELDSNNPVLNGKVYWLMRQAVCDKPRGFRDQEKRSTSDSPDWAAQ
jgi:hypothetical protein